MADTKYCYPNSDVIRALALKNGYRLSFDMISDEQMLNASIESFFCKYEQIESIFSRGLTKL